MQKPLRTTAKLLTILLLLSQMTVLFSGTVYGQTDTRQLKRENTATGRKTRCA